LAEVKPKAGLLSDSGFESARDEVFAIFHDIKEAGGGVGMELVSDIGASGCSFLQILVAPGALVAKVALAHIAAVVGVIAARIHGDGGEAAKLRRTGVKPLGSAIAVLTIAVTLISSHHEEMSVPFI
jgi:hypothetical protein